VSRFTDLARRYGFEALTVFLTGTALLEITLRRDAENAPTTSLWFTLPAVAFMALALLARRRYPFGGPAAYWLLAAALSFVDGYLVTFPTSLFVLGMAAAFLLGNIADALMARVGLAIVLLGIVVVVVNLPEHSASELVFFPLLFGICWLAGLAVRERAVQAEAAEARAEQAESEREVAARIAVAEERARIARELHDVVAHAVSVMVLQTGAVRHKLPRALDDESEALEGVERTGRTALVEMRRLLGAMGSEGDGVELAPQPGLETLDSLLAEVGRAGLPVELHVSGEAVPLPRAIDLSAYRIVQEALTNALKHAQAHRADVTLRYSPHELGIEVRDDGVGVSSNDGLGHGLVGIRERVKIYGGEMRAGAGDSGGFVLAARLPLGREVGA
jgi:signal transduction histidine kinase